MIILLVGIYVLVTVYCIIDLNKFEFIHYFLKFRRGTVSILCSLFIIDGIIKLINSSCVILFSG